MEPQTGYNFNVPTFQKAANVSFITPRGSQGYQSRAGNRGTGRQPQEEEVVEGLSGDVKGFYHGKYILENQENALIREMMTGIDKAGSYKKYASDNNPLYREHLKKLSELEQNKVSLDVFKGSMKSRVAAFSAYNDEVRANNAMTSIIVDAAGRPRMIKDQFSGKERYMTYGDQLTFLESRQGYTSSVGSGLFAPEGQEMDQPIDPALGEKYFMDIAQDLLSIKSGDKTTRNYILDEESVKPLMYKDEKTGRTLPVWGGENGAVGMVMSVGSGHTGNIDAVNKAINRVLTSLPEDVRRSLQSEYYAYEQRSNQYNQQLEEQGKKAEKVKGFGAWVADKAKNTFDMYKMKQTEYTEGDLKDPFGYADKINEKQNYWAGIQNSAMAKITGNREMMNQVYVDEKGNAKVHQVPGYRRYHHPEAVNSLAKSLGVDGFMNGSREITDSSTRGNVKIGQIAPYAIASNGSKIDDPRILNNLRVIRVGGDVMSMPGYGRDGSTGRYKSEFTAEPVIDPATKQQMVDEYGAPMFDYKMQTFQRLSIGMSREGLDEADDVSGQLRRTDIVNKQGGVGGEDDIVNIYGGRVPLGFMEDYSATKHGKRWDTLIEFDVWVPIQTEWAYENVQMGQQGTTGNARQDINIANAFYDAANNVNRSISATQEALNARETLY